MSRLCQSSVFVFVVVFSLRKLRARCSAYDLSVCMYLQYFDLLTLQLFLQVLDLLSFYIIEHTYVSKYAYTSIRDFCPSLRFVFLFVCRSIDGPHQVEIVEAPLFRLLVYKSMAGSVHEPPEFGVGDFVLLHDITLDAFMDNLKLRWGFSFEQLFFRAFLCCFAAPTIQTCAYL